MKIITRIVVGLALLGGISQSWAQLNYVVYNGAAYLTGFNGAGKVEIPETTDGYPVVYIGPQTFFANSEITDISIPATVTNIAFRAIYGCNGLTNITVDSQNPVYSSYQGALFTKDHGTLVQFPTGYAGRYTVPANVKNIGQEAFVGSTNLTEVILSGSVTNIERDAFANCYSLTNFQFSTNLCNLGGGVFAVDRGLKNLILPTGITTLGTSLLLSSGITHIVIPETVTNIGAAAFCGSTNLRSVTIPASVTLIDSSAFESCSGLESLFFKGNAPATNRFACEYGIAYYLPGTTGWNTNFAGIPTALWNPTGVAGNRKTNGFGFTITGTQDIPLVVEVSTNLGNSWQPLKSLTLTNGACDFRDPQATNYGSAFYRFRSP
ncbi:MAG TPA: leucine-rich repeat domain-containing protein [Verrucomicrobiae bacterium]